MSQAAKRLSLVLLIACALSGCAAEGRQVLHQAAAEPTRSAAAAERPQTSNVIKEYASEAPLGTYLGSRGHYLVIKAEVVGRGDAVDGPSLDSRRADGEATTVYTPYQLSNVEVLRGGQTKVQTLLVEGGTTSESSVAVEGGALAPEPGSTIYAVIGNPADAQSPIRFSEGTARAAHIFPVTNDGSLFLPSYVVLDPADAAHAPDAEYSAAGQQYKGRKVNRARAEQIIRNAP